MKIGILTLPLNTNYGGILQAYALQTVLERMGHKVDVFDTPNNIPLPPLWKLPLYYTKRTLLKCLGKSQRIFAEQYQNKIRPIIASNIQTFVDTHIHRRVINSFKEIKENEYDAIVVGSDQVWRPIYFVMWNAPRIEDAYLSFSEGWNIKRIAYAASFGTSEWEYDKKQTEKCKGLIKNFDAISVREESGSTLISQKFNAHAEHVLDPTMLLEASDYETLYKKTGANERQHGYLLKYVLDENEEINGIVDRTASGKHLTIFSVNNPYEYDESRPLKDRIKPSVETWLQGFHNAEFVVTDSFHACVFSIIFKKQFVVIGNKSRGMARFESLLEMFGLEHRLIDDGTDIENLRPIDYEVVYSRYDEWKDLSFKFLKSNLS